MDDLIRINNDGDRPWVLGRRLHKALEIKTQYKDWLPRMCEYGFVEGQDFNPLKNEQVRFEGSRLISREVVDHLMTLSMAKELCMLQRTELGKQFRQYFIKVEEAWNTPEAVMARALQLAQKHIDSLSTANQALDAKVSELKPKADYHDMVLNSKDLLPITTIAKDYGMSGKAMNLLLHEMGIQFRQGEIWLLYQDYADKGYVKTKTYPYLNEQTGQMGSKVSTYWTQKGRLFLYDLLKERGLMPLIDR